MDIALYTLYIPPLSEYPAIPGILRRFQDHPGMDIHLVYYHLVQYLGILQQFYDHGMSEVLLSYIPRILWS